MNMLAVLRWINSLNGSLFPHLSLSNEDLISTFTTISEWCSSPVRAFSWHPHCTKLAYALQDDSIQIHAAGHTLVPILKHKLQKNVADLAWKPLSASVLAVACQSCVLVWHVEPTSLATRPSTSCAQVLQQSGHAPVTSLAWSPDGDVLLSASAADTAILAWCVPREVCVTLRRSGGGGVSLLRWSPDGSKVFAATPSPIFRVWESKSWACEVWSQLAGRCKSACWSPDGHVLLFAVENDPILYSVKFTAKLTEGHVDSTGSNTAVAVADLSEINIQTRDGENERVGGIVRDMVWDPSGDRLAVMFEANGYVAVFKTNTYPVLELLPCGFVKGQDGEVPHHISFQPQFEQGALLTVVWSSGRIGYVPLLFMRTVAPVGLERARTDLMNGRANASLYSS